MIFENIVIDAKMIENIIEFNIKLIEEEIEKNIYLDNQFYDEEWMDEDDFNKMLKQIAKGKFFPKQLKKVNQIMNKYKNALPEKSV